MKTVKFLSMAALIVMGAIFASCVKINDSVDPVAEDNIVVCTTSINLEEADGTKALTSSGVKTFADGDRIAVIYKNTSNQTVKAVSEAISSGAGTASATFSVTLTNPDNTKAIRYIYPAAMAKATVATETTMDDAGTVDFTNLNNQNGSLTTLGSTLDLCTYDAANWTSGTLPNGTMTNKLAILAITLKDNAATPAEITDDITGMTLSDGTNNYAVTREAAAGPIYVAIQPTDDATITVTATDGTKNYTKTLTTTKTYEASNGYSVSWKMTKTYDGLATPLTFEAKADGFYVSLTTGLAVKPSLQYSIDGGDWTDYVFPLTTLSVSTGHTISFRAKTTNGAFADEYNTTSFECSEACYIYGNVMSLLSKDDFATATSVPAYAFLQLFIGNANISNHPTKALALPATTLATSCYEGMFMMCSGLTTAPNLPATSLAARCYNNMFYFCSALTTAPNLPATTLTESCYDNMFSDCTGLVNAPAISATTLAAHCCATMFNRCTSLVTGPTLSATTLTDYCYNGMFNGCSSLTSVTCLATDISADYCLNGWLSGATATGTLYVDASMTGASWDVPGTWSVAAH